jgi:hypothetical protein
MDKMPERIWAYHIWSFGTGFVETNYGEWHPGVETKYRLDKTEYLRSTPLLEHAGETLGLLKDCYRILQMYTHDTPLKNEVQGYLAFIEKAEKERGGG